MLNNYESRPSHHPNFSKSSNFSRTTWQYLANLKATRQASTSIPPAQEVRLHNYRHKLQLQRRRGNYKPLDPDNRRYITTMKLAEATSALVLVLAAASTGAEVQVAGRPPVECVAFPGWRVHSPTISDQFRRNHLRRSRQLPKRLCVLPGTWQQS